MKNTFTLLSNVGKVAYKLYKKDRDHYVRLLEPYTVGRFLIDVPDFDCALFTLQGGTLTLKPAEAKHCDGATLAPDKIGGTDFAGAYIAHDFWYEAIKDMAKDERFMEAGFDADKLQEIGDAILAAQMAVKSRFWARVYYWAVRTFGGLARRLQSVGIVAFFAALLLSSGCAGCLSLPDGIFEPSGSDPVYETTPREASVREGPSNAVFSALCVRNVAGACLHVESPADDCRAN